MSNYKDKYAHIMSAVKVLVVVPNLRVSNGVTSYAMNYYRNMNPKKIKMDFLLLSSVYSPYHAEINKRKDKVHFFPDNKANAVEIIQFMDQVIKKNNYDIIHSHVLNVSSFLFYSAAKERIKARILHSHSTITAEKKWKEIRNNFLSIIGKRLSTHLFACSKLAGSSIYGRKTFSVINNAIDVDIFLFDKKIRSEVRTDLLLDGKLVVGTVGRIALQKNPYFIVRIVESLGRIHPNSIFLWIGTGTGELDDKIKKLVKLKNIEKHILFLGNRMDVNRLYQAMDVFILPSIYEGLPIVGIEAQASGLPVIASDNISHEVKITENLEFMSIEKTSDAWAKKILLVANNKSRKNMKNELVAAGYEIKTAAQQLERKYLQIAAN